MESSTEAATRRADLRQSGAGLCDNGAHHTEGVLALAFGAAEAVGRWVQLVEKCSVDFSLAVGPGARDDAALDAEGGGVASCIASLGRC
jgi:hypothetical protein